MHIWLVPIYYKVLVYLAYASWFLNLRILIEIDISFLPIL